MKELKLLCWALATTSAATLACQTHVMQTPSADLPPAGADGEYEVDFPEPREEGTARYIGIELGPDEASTCPELSPKFHFDKSEPRAQDRTKIHMLAGCLNTPELRDKPVVLVGRADPRGSDRYNDALGRSRSETVRNMLVDAGVREDRISILSEGEQDAKGGEDEYSYGYDRRVELHVMGMTHRP